MALLSSSLRMGASHPSSRLPNNSSSIGKGASSLSQHCVLPTTAPVQCCRFRRPSTVTALGLGVLPPLRLTSNLSRRAQLTGTPTAKITSTGSETAPGSASGEMSSMAAQIGNCSSSGMELLSTQVSIPARVVGGFIASCITLAGRLLGSAGYSGRGGSEVEGEPKVGDVTDVLRLGCGALVTPTEACSSSISWPQYFPAMHDIFASVATMAGALVYLQIFNELAKRQVLDKKLSRKLVHIGVGLVFMLFWPLFTSAAIAPYLAAFAPAMNGVRMLLIGSGLMDNEAIVKAMTREGDRRELLKGPSYYALAVVVTTVGFWRTSPVGIVALVNLCAGDGFADIIGRNFGTRKLPYNEYKSIAGTVGFVIMSSLVSMLYLNYFSAFGLLKILPGTFVGVLLVSFFTGLVESLPISTVLDDNLTVPFTAIVLGLLFLPTS